MKSSVNINNKYFMYTIIGVMLLIGALGFALANFASIATLSIMPTLAVGTMGASAVSLLSKAIKADKHRLHDEPINA